MGNRREQSKALGAGSIVEGTPALHGSLPKAGTAGLSDQPSPIFSGAGRR